MIKVSKRISEIVAEAVGNKTVSFITSAERMEIGQLYERLTDTKIDVWCNVCIIQACFLIKNNCQVGELKQYKHKK